MKGLETGKDKVKKICEALRKETLEPAKEEAEQIIERARMQAEEMLAEAAKSIEAMHKDAKSDIQREKNVFQSSLNQACKQALESLKQSIEEKLFNQELGHLLAHHTQDPAVLTQLINAVVKALEKEGTDADISVYIPAAVPARAVNQLLAQEVLQKLKEKSVLLSPIGGGIQVKVHQGNLTIDMSASALKELVANYIRKDFREILFSAG